MLVLEDLLLQQEFAKKGAIISFIPGSLNYGNEEEEVKSFKKKGPKVSLERKKPRKGSKRYQRLSNVQAVLKFCDEIGVEEKLHPIYNCNDNPKYFQLTLADEARYEAYMNMQDMTTEAQQSDLQNRRLSRRPSVKEINCGGEFGNNHVYFNRINRHIRHAIKTSCIPLGRLQHMEQHVLSNFAGTNNESHLNTDNNSNSSNDNKNNDNNSSNSKNFKGKNNNFSITKKEDEIKNKRKETLLVVCDNSFDRLMIHAIAQYYDLNSESFNQNCTNACPWDGYSSDSSFTDLVGSDSSYDCFILNTNGSRDEQKMDMDINDTHRHHYQQQQEQQQRYTVIRNKYYPEFNAPSLTLVGYIERFLIHVNKRP